jgi:DNA-binding transcriptional LysR family regulator
MNFTVVIVENDITCPVISFNINVSISVAISDICTGHIPKAMISVRHEVFIEVVNHLSFSKASEVLFMSQPAISKHVKALEEKYRTSLFDRKGNTIHLSEAGKLLYTHLMEVKKIQNQLEFGLSTLNDALKAKGQLKLGASTTVALYILPKILSAFHQKFPDVKISLLNRNTESIVKALVEQDIDVGIVEARNKTSALHYHSFMSDEVVAVCSSKSPIAQKRSLTVEEIKSLPVALREQGSGTLSALKQALGKHNIKLSDLKVGVRLAGTEALKNFLKEDDCLGFLPKRSLLKELRDDELVLLDIPELHIRREFFFIQRHGADNSGLNKAFINFAKTYYNK